MKIKQEILFFLFIYLSILCVCVLFLVCFKLASMCRNLFFIFYCSFQLRKMFLIFIFFIVTTLLSHSPPSLFFIFIYAYSKIRVKLISIFFLSGVIFLFVLRVGFCMCGSICVINKLKKNHKSMRWNERLTVVKKDKGAFFSIGQRIYFVLLVRISLVYMVFEMNKICYGQES